MVALDLWDTEVVFGYVKDYLSGSRLLASMLVPCVSLKLAAGQG